MSGADDVDELLRDLFAAERRHPGPPPEVQARVKAAVLASVALAASTASASAAGAALSSSAATSATSASAATAASAASAASPASASGGALAVVGAALTKPAVVVAAALAATTVGGVYVSRYELPQAPAAQDVVVAASPPPAPRMPPPPVPPPPVVAAPREAQRLPPPKTPSKTPPKTPPPMTAETPTERASRLAAERGLIAEARGALGRGAADSALLALEAHRSRYPEGQLAEEREALTVMALARAGRIELARAKAAAFSARWPRSLFQPAVDAALPRP